MKHLRDQRTQRVLAALLFASVLAIGAVGLLCEIAFRADHHTAVTEYLSYALAAFAALLAGANVYLKAEVRWFWLSSVLVAIGLVTFLQSRHYVGPAFLMLLLSYGAVSSVFIYPTLRVFEANRGKEHSVTFGVLALSVTFVLLVVCVFVGAHLLSEPSSVEKGSVFELACRGKAPQFGQSSTLVCTDLDH